MPVLKPVFEKDGKTDKENCRSISILPTLGKVYERVLYNQIDPYFDKVFQNSNVVFEKVLMLSIVWSLW